MTAEKLMETIQKADVPISYQPMGSEVVALWKAHENDWFGAMCAAFDYGFLKGQRAERATTKKKAKERYRQEMEKHAPGYGLLLAIIERNMSNKKFVGCALAFARRMDGCADKKVTPDE